MTYVKLNPNARILLLNDSLIIICITVNYISNRNLTNTYYGIQVSCQQKIIKQVIHNKIDIIIPDLALPKVGLSIKKDQINTAGIIPTYQKNKDSNPFYFS
ncbi:unnamed protein product [Paramecium sonneborni]|uniref:Uncharacterized protein n=1 Tax=Paramecium sonneborni TaxID=65129 RepID=A0A8S1KP10_9CILI|nr:unnamed protein product [Paramecium sonneborni]